MRPTQPSPIPGPAPSTAPNMEPAPAGSPATREIPVSQPVTATLVEELIGGARPTGPVEGLPPLPTPEPVPDDATAAAPPGHPTTTLPAAADPAAPPAAGQPAAGATALGETTEDKAVVGPRPRRGLRSGALLGLGLGAAAVALLEVGLTLRFGGPRMWSTVPLWAGFASLAALAGLAGVAGQAPMRGRWPAARAWSLGAAGLAGVAVFWLLVVLPTADTNRGFVLTAALACLGAALWTVPRREPGQGA